MIYLVAAAIAIAAGIAAGGSIKGLANLKFRYGWLFIIVFFIQALFQFMLSKGAVFPAGSAIFLCAFVNLLLTAAFFRNWKLPGVLVIWAGMMLNAAVMLANGGKMPVDGRILAEHGMDRQLKAITSGLDARHMLMDADTRLSFLADRIRPPAVLSVFSGVVSFGDLVIAAGLFALIFCLVYNFKKADNKTDNIKADNIKTDNIKTDIIKKDNIKKEVQDV